MNNKKITKSTKLKLILISVLTVFIIGTISYGAFFVYKEQTDNNMISSSCFSSSFTESDSINMQNTLPISDSEGLETTPYNFTITNTCNLTSIYYVILNVKTNSWSDSYVKVSTNGKTSKLLNSYEVNTEYTKPAGYTNSYIIASGSLDSNQSSSMGIRLWLNESVTYDNVSGKTWEGQIKVVSVVAGTQTYSLAKSDYVADFGEDESGANTPNLDNNMVPVVYDEETSEWIKASKEQMGWYNYSQQLWANAVTVTADKRGLYTGAEPGTIIPMEDILGMYVWIPRYEYNYTNLGTSYAGGTAALPGAIGINFVSGTSTTETTNYIIHPAFRNGSVTYTNNAYTTTSAYQMGGWNHELTGFWYGKFETGASTDLTTDAADTTNILIKPDVYSRRNQTVSNEYLTAKNIAADHGISLDSHMSKNSEWGAVTYLTQSNYGKYGNENYTGANKEVYLNNSSSFYTGRSMGMPGGASGNSSLGAGSYVYNDTHLTKIESTKVEGSGITLNPTVTNDTSYPWTLTNGVYKSSTQGVQSSTTNLSFDFVLPSTGDISFDWSVSSESASYDYIYYTITKDGTTLSGTGTSNKIGGTSYGSSDDAMTYLSVLQTLEAGAYKITFTYRKDGSVDKGTDAGYVKNLTISYGAQYVETEVPDVKNGTGASTTGNIYGVYDMVGGAFEYVMGNYNSTIGSSGLTFPEQKYYDKYTTSSAATACGGICYGHALSETGGYYGDYQNMISSGNPWFLRGSYCDHSSYTGSGVFFYTDSDGNGDNYYGFRAVLS